MHLMMVDLLCAVCGQGVREEANAGGQQRHQVQEGPAGRRLLQEAPQSMAPKLHCL